MLISIGDYWKTARALFNVVLYKTVQNKGDQCSQIPKFLFNQFVFIFSPFHYNKKKIKKSQFQVTDRSEVVVSKYIVFVCPQSRYHSTTTYTYPIRFHRYFILFPGENMTKRITLSFHMNCHNLMT